MQLKELKGLNHEIDSERDELRDALMQHPGMLPEDAESLADEWRAESLLASGFCPEQINLCIAVRRRRRSW